MFTGKKLYSKLWISSRIVRSMCTQPALALVAVALQLLGGRGSTPSSTQGLSDPIPHPNRIDHRISRCTVRALAARRPRPSRVRASCQPRLSAEFNPERTPLIPLTPQSETEEVRSRTAHAHLISQISQASCRTARRRQRRPGTASMPPLWRTERKEAGAVTTRHSLRRFAHPPPTCHRRHPPRSCIAASATPDTASSCWPSLGRGTASRGVSLSGSGWQIAPATHFEIKDGFFGTRRRQLHRRRFGGRRAASTSTTRAIEIRALLSATSPAAER